MPATVTAETATPPRRWRRVAPAASALILLTGLLGASVQHAAPAHAAPSGTFLFHYSDGATTWTVPAGVYAIEVQAVGGSGGAGVFTSGYALSPGGFGGTVDETLSVTPGQVLDIHPGQQGKDANVNISVPGARGGAGFDGRTGGFGGLGSNDLIVTTQSGGGGGGASEVLLDGNIIAVAGGGGGGGGAGTGFVSNLAGGRGGDAGHWGSNGASSAAGGAGLWDQSYGQNAESGQILGADGGGGGGGGGWYGGHGGDSAWDGGGGGGGAGGSNWASAPGATLGDAGGLGDGWVQIRQIPHLTAAVDITVNTATALNNNPVTLTAKLIADDRVPNAPQPTGTVTFRDNDGTTVTAPVVNGQAQFLSYVFKVGPHAITAVYNGDGTYVPSSTPDAARFTILQGDNSDLLSATTLDFGDTPTGQDPVVKTITVTNTGNTPWLFRGAAVASPSPFSYIGGTCQDLGLIAIGGSCTVTAGFAPQAAGSTSDTLVLVSSTGTQNVPLTGTGVAPDPHLSLSGDFDFGSVVQGYTGKHTVTLTNTGNVVLHERWTYTVDQNNADAGDILLDNASTCGTDLTIQALAPGQSCNLILDFNATRVGSLSAEMLFSGTAAAQTPLRANTAAEQRTISITPSPLAFGPLPVNHHAVKQVTITNTGNVNWQLAGIGTDGINLNVSDTTCNTGPLVPGNSCTVTVDYYPTKAGEDDHSLQFDDGHGNLTALPVTGSGIVQSAKLSDTSLDFGKQDVGSDTVKTITVTNNGNVDWAASGITTTGPVTVDQTVPGSCVNRQPVAATQSCTLTVHYAPTASGESDGSVVLSSTTADVTIPVTGFGVVHSVAVAPTTVDFGAQLVGSSTPKTVTLSNTGNTDFLVYSAGTNNADLNLSGGSCVTGATAAGQTCTLDLLYTPGHTGSDNGVLTLTTSAGTVTIPATGSGVAVVKSVTVAPSSAAFGSQVVGAPAVTKQVTITNTGNVDWSWTSAHTTTGEFNLAGGSCFTPPLAPGASCTFNVTFAPGATGSRTGTITLTSSSGPVALTATSTGVAAVRKISVSPQVSSFGTVLAGSSSTKTVTVTNTGNLPWNFASATLKGAGAVNVTGGSCSTSTPVAPAGSCTVTLEYRPTGAQLLLADLAIAGSAGTSHVVLTGAGVPQVKRVTYSASTLTFGNQATGSRTAKTITIRNAGNVAWVPTSVQIPGGQPFMISSSGCTLGAALAPGHSCTFTVSFAPRSSGSFVSAVTVTANFAGAKISLTGAVKRH